MREPRRSSLKATAIALLLGATLALPASGQSPAPETPPVVGPAQIRLSTFVALPGLPIRIPLARPQGNTFGTWVPEPMTVRLLDPNGSDPPQTLVSEIIGFTTPQTDTTSASTPWLAEPAGWQAVRPADVTSGSITSPVYWSLFVRLPASYDEAHARSPRDGRDRAVLLEIAGERFPARLAERPKDLPTGRIAALEAPADEWRSLGELILAEASDPARRWRASLLADRFSPGRLFGTASLDERQIIEDPNLAGLATTIEFEVRAALSELEAENPDLAASLLARLTAVSRGLDGRLLPVWPTDGEAETILFPALLSRALTAEERAARVRQYLDSRPASRSVVIDDAGESLVIQSNERFREGGEEAEQILIAQGATAVTTNLAGENRTLTFGPPGEFDAALLQLPAYSTSVIRFDPSVVRPIEPNASPERDRVVAGAIELRDGDRQRRLEARVVPVEIKRPGLQIGPALSPWTLVSWNADAVVPVALDEQTTALIYHDDRASTWRVLVEARARPADAAAHSIDLFFGPYAGESEVVRIAPDASVTVQTTDGWSTIIDFPEGAIRQAEATGFVEIGFVRWHRTGPEAEPKVHSSWPRPWFPGQTKPGRVRVDLSGWTSN